MLHATHTRTDAPTATAKQSSRIDWETRLPPLPLPLYSAGCFSTSCANNADEGDEQNLTESDAVLIVGGEGEESYSTATFVLENAASVVGAEGVLQKEARLQCTGTATIPQMRWRNGADVPGSVFFGGAVSLPCSSADIAGGLLLGTMWSHARSCIRSAAYDPLNESWSSRPTPQRLCSPVLGCALGLPLGVESCGTASADGCWAAELGCRNHNTGVMIISGDGRAWLYQGAGLTQCRQARSPPQRGDIQAVTNVAGGAVVVSTDKIDLYDESSDSWWGPLPAAVHAATSGPQLTCSQDAATRNPDELERMGQLRQAETVLLLYSRLVGGAAPGRRRGKASGTTRNYESGRLWEPSALTADFNDE